MNHEPTNGAAPPAATLPSGSVKLITAIVQRGKADDPVQAAIDAGAQGATIVFGRGQGIRERLGLLGLAVQPEKEIVYIVVEEELLDRVLTAMIKTGHLDQPGVGFIYVTPVERTVGLLQAEEREAIVRDARRNRRSLLRRG
jgi:nitrogen regulatory protein PII